MVLTSCHRVLWLSRALITRTACARMTCSRAHCQGYREDVTSRGRSFSAFSTQTGFRVALFSPQFYKTDVTNRRNFSSDGVMPCTMWSEVNSFWCNGDPYENAKSKWFGAPPSVNEDIRLKFSDLVEKALKGDLEDWEESREGAFALLILLDQFPRTLYKGTTKAFSGEGRALRIVKKFVGEDAVWDYREMSFTQRLFISMPLEHHENMESQVLTARLTSELLEDFKNTSYEKLAESFKLYAKLHTEVIEMFGRYPQRNAALGRTNTPEEEKFLSDMPSKYAF